MYYGGTASYHLGMAFLCFISPDWKYCRAHPCSCTRKPPLPVVLGPTWMGPGSDRSRELPTCTSASRAGRALEGRLRHLLHRAVAPSTSTTYRAGIRKCYAFCHKFNPGKKHSINLLLRIISFKRGVRKDRLWERDVYQSGHAYPS